MLRLSGSAAIAGNAPVSSTTQKNPALPGRDSICTSRGYTNSAFVSLDFKFVVTFCLRECLQSVAGATLVTLTEPKTQTRWPCVPLGSEIECTPRVLHTICLEASLGLRKLTKGGLEVGGMLFGERAEGLIRVLAVRPIECEHRFGPSFILSDADEAKLQATLEKFKTDEELDSLEILGCYFSHSRHGATLTDGDIKLCDRFLSDKDQIAVTLIPNSTGGVRGTVLARVQGTFVPCHEFEYSVLNSAPNETVRRRPTDRRSPTPLKNVAVPAQESIRNEPGVTDPAVNAVLHLAKSEPVLPAVTAAPPKTQYGQHKLKSALLLGLLILFACWPHRSIPVTQLQLRFTDNENKLMIRWDAEQQAVREASLAKLDIRDGNQEPQHLSIGADVLRQGVMAYERKSELVRISLSLVARGVTVSDSAIYFAPQHPHAPASPSQLSEVKMEAKPEEATTSPVRNPARIDPETAILVPRDGDRKKLPRDFHAPVDLVARSGSGISTKPAILPDPPALRLDSSADTVPLQHASPVSLPSPRLAKLPLASGRLIWTGRLPKRSMLSLSAQGASLGYLDGWIPRRDVKVEVRAAELMEGGMVIFTREPNLRPESPSVSNGWNTVVYKQDLARASELEILDAPGPANDWSQLVLRNGVRSLSVIVVDWRTEKN